MSAESADSWPNIGDEVEVALRVYSYVKRKRYWFEKGWRGQVVDIDRALDNKGKLQITPSGVLVDFGRRPEHGRRDNSITWVSKLALKKPKA